MEYEKRRVIQDKTTQPKSTPFRWWNTLFFRLAVVVNVVVVGVFAGLAAHNYRTQRTTQTDNEIERLRGEARVLRAGWNHLPDPVDFQDFLNEFCRQVGSAASPGHHIAVFDKNDHVLLRAHQHANPELEAQMAAAKVGQAMRFRHNGERYISVNVGTSGGEIIAVAQSLAPIEALLQAQSAATFAGTGILVVLIFGVTTIGFLLWVRAPLRNLVRGVTAIGQRHFGSRVRLSGTAELRFLAQQVNQMARTLQRTDQGRRLEMARAREIQQGLLPVRHYVSEDFEMAGFFLPAASVGGDLYDIVELSDGSILLAMLDVSGHGVPAALYTALLRSVVRHHAAQTTDLCRIAEAMNRGLCEVTPGGEFATCLLVRLVPTNAHVEYVSAGHGPAIIVHENGHTALPDGSDLVLGVDSTISYQLRTADLNRSDRLFLFTDGLHEVFGAQNRVLGRDRLAVFLAESNALPLEQQIEAVIRRVRDYGGEKEFDDDVTLLAVKRA